MNNFYEKLSYSLGHQQTVDCNILRSHIPKCIGVEKTSVDIDRTGVDYIATLQGGTKIFIDAKTRTPGCSRYWKGEPELAIETWSVVEKKIPGWTFNEKSDVDYILYTFPKEDYAGYFFIPFQLLLCRVFFYTLSAFAVGINTLLSRLEKAFPEALSAE